MMFARLSAVATFAFSLVASASAAYLAPISESGVSQCADLKFTVSGKAPLKIYVYPGCGEEDESDDPITEYTVNGTTAYWKVDVEEGKSIMFGVEDATGNFDWTEDYTVGKSSDKSCLGLFTQWSTSPISSATSSSSTGPSNINNAGQGVPSPSISAAPEPAAKPLGAASGALSSFTFQAEVMVFTFFASVFGAVITF